MKSNFTMATSTNGLNWTLVASGLFSTAMRAVLYTDNKFVAAGEGSNNAIATSTDGGSTWYTPVASNSYVNIGRGLAYNSTTNQVYLAGTYSSRMFGPGNAVAFAKGASVSAIFTGSISGTTLTVTSVFSGTIAVGMIVTGRKIQNNTLIVSGSGTTWTVSVAQTTASQSLTGTTPDAVVVATVSGASITVTSTVSGALTRGMVLTGNGIEPGTIITGGSGPNWTLNVSLPPAVGTTIRGHKNIFVGGGSGAFTTIAISAYGKVWTGVGAPLTTSCRGLLYTAGNNRPWVAVGSGSGTILYSTDGVTWTTVTNSLGTQLFSTSGYAVAYSPPPVDRWVFVGEGTNSLAYVSGSTWTQASDFQKLGLTLFTTRGTGVVWGGPAGQQKFVAVGVGASSNSVCIAWSSNGINWYEVPESRYIFYLGATAVAWGGASGQEKFVATGNNINCFAYSYDGVSWLPASGIQIMSSGANSLLWCETQNVWLAGGTSTTNTTAYSFDGIVWYSAGNLVTGGGTGSQSCNALAYGNNMFVGMCSGTSATTISYAFEEPQNLSGLFNWITVTSSLVTSMDGGTTWEGIPNSYVMMNTCNTVATNGSKWVAGGTGAIIGYCDDNETWGTFNSTPVFVKWIPTPVSKFILAFNAVARNMQSLIARSDDGINWIFCKTGPTQNMSFDAGSVAYSPTLSLIVVQGGAAAISTSAVAQYNYTSVDGITWTGAVNGVRNGATLWVPFPTPLVPKFLVFSSNQVIQSTNGATWTVAHILKDNFSATLAVWSPALEKVCVIGNGESNNLNNVAVSSDGVNWQYGNIPANFYLGLTWSDTYGVFCAVSYTNYVQQCIFSTDGLNWYQANTLNSIDQLRWVMWNATQQKFIAVGRPSTRPAIYVSKLLS